MISLIKKTPKYRLVILLLLILGLIAETKYFLSFYGDNYPTIYSLILGQTNDMNVVCFYLAFTFTFIMNGIILENKRREIISIKVQFLNIKMVFLTSLIIICMYLLINLFVHALFSGFNLNYKNEWLGGVQLGITPIVALFLSLLYLYFRLVFFGGIILTIKNKYGYLIVIIINIIEWYVRIPLDLSILYGLLPIDNTLIFYTDNAAMNIEYAHRSPYYISILYWIFMLVCLFSSYILIPKLKGNNYDKRNSQIY